jgi:hypothetical protein
MILSTMISRNLQYLDLQLFIVSIRLYDQEIFKTFRDGLSTLASMFNRTHEAWTKGSDSNAYYVGLDKLPIPSR